MELGVFLDNLPSPLATGISYEECLSIKEAFDKLSCETQIIEDNQSTRKNNYLFNKEEIKRLNIQNARRSDIPRCPKCGSTSITTGARGVNWKLGLIGASKTVNRCGRCGFTYDPKTGKKA